MERASYRLARFVSRVLFVTEGEPSVRKGIINGLLVYLYVAASVVIVNRLVLFALDR